MTAAKRCESVWDAIEDSPGQAENLKIRSALMAELAAYIERAGLTRDQFRAVHAIRGRAVCLFETPSL